MIDWDCVNSTFDAKYLYSCLKNRFFFYLSVIDGVFLLDVVVSRLNRLFATRRVHGGAGMVWHIFFRESSSACNRKIERVFTSVWSFFRNEILYSSKWPFFGFWKWNTAPSCRIGLFIFCQLFWIVLYYWNQFILRFSSKVFIEFAFFFRCVLIENDLM